MTPAQYWNSLTPTEQKAAMALLRYTNMRATPVLLTLRYHARKANLANREIRGPRAAGIEWARWMAQTGRIAG